MFYILPSNFFDLCEKYNYTISKGYNFIFTTKMPELPEVQTIIDDLNKKIIGDKVVGFWSDWKKTIKNMSGAEFARKINERRVLRARRIGKNLLIDLSKKNSRLKNPEKTLYIHLKMTGHLLVKDREILKKARNNFFEEKVNQYIHHSWELQSKNGRSKLLEFSDLRKFGKILLVDFEEVMQLPEIKKLGIDAISRKFNLKKFKEILEKKQKSRIGTVLMDQSLIAGIGNIYRSEILFESGVMPDREVGKLSEKEIDKIFYQIKNILEKAIKMRGTSDSDYRDTSGAPGEFHKVLKVYRKEKKKCKKCASIIKRIKLSQRSAFYCPGCQK